jgi:hypothetical protein
MVRAVFGQVRMAFRPSVKKWFGEYAIRSSGEKELAYQSRCVALRVAGHF